MTPVKSLEPFLPAHTAQIGVVAAKIYPQHAQMITVFRTFNRGRNSAALFGPLPDDLVASLRPSRSGSSSVEVTSCEYFSELDEASPCRILPPSGPAPRSSGSESAPPSLLSAPWDRALATSLTSSSFRMPEDPLMFSSF